MMISDANWPQRALDGEVNASDQIVVLLERIAVALEKRAGQDNTKDLPSRSAECIWGLLSKAAAEQAKKNKKTAALTLSMLRRYDLKTWDDVRHALCKCGGVLRQYSRVSHKWFVEFAASHGESIPTADDLGWSKR
jgi:predicted short-subunit dehydrogenase-like oxidoreductase (DUF2520 family)